MKEREDFIGLVKLMLNQDERITPGEALTHPVLTGFGSITDEVR
jgi:hypothetical protein